MAIKTWDGKTEPELQALPEETAKPSISSAIRSDSPRTPSKRKCEVFIKAFVNNRVFAGVTVIAWL